jgi:hypothetical protein
MENLKQIIEKVLTLNVNANTNIDIQDIITKYILYTTIGKVLLTFFICLCLIIILILIIRGIVKCKKMDMILKKGDEFQGLVEKFDDKLQRFNNWREIENIDKVLNAIFEGLSKKDKHIKEKFEQIHRDS